ATAARVASGAGPEASGAGVGEWRAGWDVQAAVPDTSPITAITAMALVRMKSVIVAPVQRRVAPCSGNGRAIRPRGTGIGSGTAHALAVNARSCARSWLPPALRGPARPGRRRFQRRLLSIVGRG